jgi:predicted NUDIX family NTP pyrophosphohydrolase
MYRVRHGTVEVLLVHPGGPFWAGKDEGVWSIPKGEFTDEDPLAVARREFQEETGYAPPPGVLRPLTPIRQSGGKWVYAWTLEGDCDAETIRSNTFEVQWPPHSGRRQTFPEVDRAGWFSLTRARDKILKSQQSLLDQLEQLLRQPPSGSP